MNAPTLLPGTQFAGVRIVRLVATGEVAEVYEAIDAEGARRALKVVQSDIPPDTQPQRRTGQEGEAIAMLEHAHIVRFYDARIERGRVCLLLEYVEGVTLRQLMERSGGALPVERAVSLIRQACEGMVVAHAQGIIHRDLRPENLLVAKDDVVKVGDFGSAKMPGWNWGVRTTDAQELGSALYQAPEFLLSRSNETDLMDVYALGVVLYESIAGFHPIGQGSTNLAQVVQRQVLHEPPPLAMIVGEEHGDLSYLLQQAMAKSPAQRLSMEKFHKGLVVVLDRLRAPRRAAARSIPIPQVDSRLAPTVMNNPAWRTTPVSSNAASTAPTGPRGTVQMPASPPAAYGPSSSAPDTERMVSGGPVASPPAAQSYPEPSRDAPRSPVIPPAPSVIPSTLRSAVAATQAMPSAEPAPKSGAEPRSGPAPTTKTGTEVLPVFVVQPAATPPSVTRVPRALAATRPMDDGALDRRSSGAPVESNVPQPVKSSRAVWILSVVGALVATGIALAWLLLDQGSTRPAPAAPPPPSATSSSSVPASSLTPGGSASATRPQPPHAPKSGGLRPSP